MNFNRILKPELVSDNDFQQYLSNNLLNLPTRFHNSKISKIEDISGNVNRVKRVTFDSNKNSTLVIKHVPKDGKLAKYPSISFASDRLEFEYKWFNQASRTFKKIKGCKVKVPNIAFFDKSMRLLIMEDLGTTSFSDYLSANHNDYNLILKNLGTAIATTHIESTKLKKESNLAACQNRPYIFSFHLSDPAAVADIWKTTYSQDSLTTLQELLKYQKEFIDTKSSQLSPILTALESSYLNCQEPVFTHGDLHSKSIIVTKEKEIGIIDAELSDFGDRAFDIGFLSAHLVAELISLEAPASSLFQLLIEAYLDTYELNTREKIHLFKEQVVKFLGAELLRRLMGPAGFNVNLSCEKFEYLVSLSYDCLLDPNYALKRLTLDINQ